MLFFFVTTNMLAFHEKSVLIGVRVISCSRIVPATCMIYSFSIVADV